MSRHRPLDHARRMPILNGILLLVILVVLLQLFLLTSTMNAYLGGDTSLLVPAGLASVVCLVLNVGLLRYLVRLG